MSLHQPQIEQKKLAEHQIQTNLDASYETQHKQTPAQNNHKEEDKHGKIDKPHDNQNQKIQQQPSQSQNTKQLNKKEQAQGEHVQQNLQQKVDIVQLSPNAHKIQQPKIQAPQVLSQVNIKEEQTKPIFLKQQKPIQQTKENEYKVQAENQPRQPNQEIAPQLKNKLNNEAKQQIITQKEKEQVLIEKESNHVTSQFKQSEVHKYPVEVNEKKESTIQHKQKCEQLRNSLQNLPNKQNLGEQKKNMIAPQEQKLKIQILNKVQQPQKPTSQQTKVNNIKQTSFKASFESQQNKVQKQKQHNQNSPKTKQQSHIQKIQNKKPILLTEQTPKQEQDQIKHTQQPEATNQISIDQTIQVKPTLDVAIVSAPVQQLETHEQGKMQIQSHEDVSEKGQSLETKIVQESKKQQNKMPISKQHLIEEQSQHKNQTKPQHNIDSQNPNVIKKQVLPVINHKLQQPQTKQTQQKNEPQNIVAQNTHNQIKQNINDSKEIQVQKEDEQPITNKQKIRVHTQYIQSVTDDNKEKDKKVVEFTQYVPTEHNQNTHQRLQDIDNTHKAALKTEVFPQKTIILQQQEQLKATFHPNYQSIDPKPQKKMKPSQIAHNIVESRQSPKKQFGKIAKRTLHDKKVHEIVTELNKFDEKKTIVPVLQPVKKSSKKMIDLSKLDTHMALKSNVMNLTIGELTSDHTQVQSSEKLLAEIESLKKKLSELQRKKEQRIKKQKEQQQSQSPQKSESNAENSKFSKKQYTGRIIKKVEQIQPLVSNKKSETIAIEPATISSASKNRITSTLGFQTQQQLDQLPETDMGKTMPINFRVRRPSKNSQNLSQFQSNQKESAKKNRQRLDSDKCFQTSRREQVFEKLEFTEEESLTVIQKPVQRQLKYEPQFRENVEKYFIEMGKQVPRKQMEQEEFVELAKKTFRKFGVNLQAERSAALSVKKYKNCISFILDSNRSIIWYYQGKFYFGGWTINQVGEGQKSGWGYQYVPGKYVYSGTFKENKRDGYGIIKFLARQNDTIYQGNWSNGFKQGLGKQLEPDGVEYIGSWSQGKKHGYGTLRISQCDYYSGYFILGVKNGEGTQVFKNGDRYVGGYKDGKFQGKGTYTWSNYSKYQGDFIEGIRNGYGFWIANYLDQTSDRYEGEYKNDKKNGYGVYKWKDGTTYQGQFLNDLKHGEGTVSYIDGRKATLQWSEGSVALRPALQKQQRNSLKRGNSSRAGSQKSESRSRRFDAKLNFQNKSKGKKVFS